MATTTRPSECIAKPEPTRLVLALELGNKTWKVASTTGMGSPVRNKTLSACNRGELEEELRAARRRFKLAADAPVVTCYEAGRDGFAPHRLLAELGIENYVVDPASIEVNRRKRRAKTDRLDAAALLRLLLAYLGGDTKRLRMVRVPSVATEDARQLHRELEAAKADVTRVRNRLTSLVVTQGGRVALNGRKPVLEQLAEVRLPDGRGLPPNLMRRLQREVELLQVLQARVEQLETERHQRVETAEETDGQVGRVRRLMQLKAVGEGGAWLLVHEHFWRDFANRREVASAAGFTPTPFQSGDLDHEQGISKAGNARVRRMVVQLAWGWIRWQPDSKLTRWFRARFGMGKRSRRIGIVGVARRLLVALWCYLEKNELPEGAVLKP